MAEKKNIDSYLNKKTKMSDTKVDAVKVQTNNLQEAVVKIPCTNYESSTPFSVLTQEFTDLNSKSSSVQFVPDTVEMSHQEVKLPSADKVEVKKHIEKIVKSNVKKEAPKKEDISKLPDIQPVSSQPKQPELSEMEILNKMNELKKEMPQEETKKVSFDVPKDAELLEKVQEAKVDKTAEDLKVLNEIQAQEAVEKKSKSVKDKIKASSNELSDLLKELEDESGTLGMG